jgi:hypothetical protein
MQKRSICNEFWNDGLSVIFSRETLLRAEESGGAASGLSEGNVFNRPCCWADTACRGGAEKKADSKKKKKLLSWIAGNGRYASTTAGRQSRRATSGDLIPSVR